MHVVIPKQLIKNNAKKYSQKLIGVKMTYKNIFRKPKKIGKKEERNKKEMKQIGST